MRTRTIGALAVSLAVPALLALPASAQAPGPLAGAVAELKQSLAANQGALAHYMWTQRTTVVVDGAQKSQKLEQVRVGPGGQEQKTLLSTPPPPPAEKPGLRGRIQEKKIDEMKTYIDGMVSLSMQYMKPAPGAVQASFEAGNAMVGGSPQPGLFDIVLKSFVKPGDSMTVSLNRQQLSISNVVVTSYMQDQTDVLNITLGFQKLPDGTNYMAKGNLNGQSKKVTITIENINFQKLAN